MKFWRITENSEILRLFSASRIYNPNEAPVADTSPADLEDRKIDLYLQKVYGKGRNDFDVSYSKLMSNLHIADKNGMLTLAGLLYFGSHPQQFKPAFNIKAVAFYGNLDGNNRNHLTTPTFVLVCIQRIIQNVFIIKITEECQFIYFFFNKKSPLCKFVENGRNTKFKADGIRKLFL